MDYTYTVQGWIKSLNSNRLNKSHDPGKDGLGFHLDFAQDVYSYSLEYFNGDYKSVGSTSHLMDKGLVTNEFNQKFVGLFNGNIGAMITNLTQQNESVNLQAQVYRYDQLNRIKSSLAINAKQEWSRLAQNDWNNSTLTSLSSTYSYDAAGNLSHLTRTDSDGNLFDDFTYHYNANTNQLNYIEDANIDDLISTQDIDNQSFGNNIYDRNGRLISDVKDGITLIKWSKSDKVLEVHKPNGVLTIKYNALDQKISQSTSRNDSIVTEYFVYDPSGNVLATYGDTIFTTNGNHRFALNQLMIYGSSRIGLLEADSLLWKDGSSNIATVSGTPKFALKLGLKRYELSNHLGNVSTVVTDRKLVESHANGQITAYKADVISVTDYLLMA